MRTKEKTGGLYDSYFRTRFRFDPRRDQVWKEVCRFIQRRYIPEDSKILDLGAGYCDFINNIRGRERHAVDVFTRFPRYAAEDVITHVDTSTDMSFFADDTFDVVFASNLVEHLPRDESTATLAEVRRVLRLGGKLILMQPNFKYCSGTYFDDYTHMQIFTEASLQDYVGTCGFRTVECLPRFMPVNMKSTLRLSLPKLPLLVRLYLSLPYRPLAGQMLFVAENRKKLPSETWDDEDW